LLFYQANQDSDDLSDFISQNKIQLQKEGLDVFLDMEGLISETYFTHRKALREYLNTYKAMLEYSSDNFEEIIQSQKPQSDIYNQLYLKYRNALDVHNEAYLHHMKFVDHYTSEHRALVEFITKARQEMREK
jgi:beta-phosphoglucomutase-like phosphatase (HAD superfamily)